MIDDSVLLEGVQLVRAYAQAAHDAQEKLGADLIALGVPVGLHGELLRLVQDAGAVAMQINASIAQGKIIPPAVEPVIGPGPAPSN